MTGSTHPMPTAEMNVPKKAKVRITPKFRKKFSYRCELYASPTTVLTCFSSYPELRMMGGSKRLKKRVCLKDYTGQVAFLPCGGYTHQHLSYQMTR